MSNNRFVFAGLEQLKADLRKLPQDLAAEGGHIVEDAGNSASVEIRTGYGKSRRTGSLQDKVSVSHRASRFGASSVIRSADREALIFEVGSQARHTRIGANRGSMPPGNVFFPAYRKWKRTMFEQLKALLVRHGLTVTDDGG